MLARNNRHSSTFSMLEVLESRQMMSVAPMVGTVHALPTVGVHAPAKPVVGPVVVKGQKVIYFGTTNGLNGNGQSETDRLTLTLTHEANGSWAGKILIINPQGRQVTTNGKVTLTAAGQITSFESGTAMSIKVTGQASSDWTSITGSYAGKDAHGKPVSGTFSLAVTT